jgi:hypothetical protein
MGAWGTAIFSDDLAADVRGEWRELLLDGAETEAAAATVKERFGHALEDEDDSIVFWLAFAAAQMETGRLQDEVRDRALASIASGGDVERWAEDDPVLARQRQRVLDRLADKLKGPQPKPKRLRRPKPLGVSFELGDVIRLRSESGKREALAVVVAQNDGFPRGTVNPVVELLAWDGGALPTRAEMRTMPKVKHLNDLAPGRKPYLRPHLWVVFTARKNQIFGPEFGEVVERGVDRAPSGDPRCTDVNSEVGATSLTWPSLCAYLDNEYAEELQLTLDEKRRSPAGRRGFLRFGV